MDSDSDDDNGGGPSNSAPIVPLTLPRPPLNSSSSSDSDDMPPLEDDENLSNTVEEGMELSVPGATQASSEAASTLGEATPKPSEAAQIIPDTVTTRPFQQRKAHPIGQILSPLNEGTKTRSYFHNLCAFQAFISLQEYKNISEAIKDPD